MFTCFSKSHEARFSALLEAGQTNPATGSEAVPLDEAFSALQACRSEVVHALQSAEVADTREQLRLLYESLSILVDFLEKRRSDIGRHLENSFVSNEAVPAERGQ